MVSAVKSKKAKQTPILVGDGMGGMPVGVREIYNK
jgi:hypothetical protein